ncbi:MAG: hypothetical protein OXK79_02635 [Chloroflexota bacterium]|nr:hypothetical protein [Chloroflexota bacterium]
MVVSYLLESFFRSLLEAVQQEPDTEGRGLGLFDWWRRRRPQGENERHG